MCMLGKCKKVKAKEVTVLQHTINDESRGWKRVAENSNGSEITNNLPFVPGFTQKTKTFFLIQDLANIRWMRV